MTRTRREFLADSLKASTLVALAGPAPGFLRRAAVAAEAERTSDKVLVVVQLSGGNDGLNTVVPFKDDLYYRRRPSIAVNPNLVHKLTDELALHPAMRGLAGLYQDKALTVIENVGYPNPSRSHFVSMDIWHSARPEKPDKSSGWLGRALSTTRAADVGKVPAISLGHKELPPALVSAGVEVPAVEDLKDFQLRLQGGSEADRARRRGLLRELSALPRPEGSEAAFLSSTMQSTLAAAEALARVTAGAAERVKYPGGSLSRQLQQAAQVMAAGFGTRIFYTSLGGFDTHSKQVPAHLQLLTQLSEALKAFWDDVKAQGRARDVLVMTFSEFGRRIEQNNSHGTDHGTAAPMFLVGGRTVGGVIGRPPNLAKPVDGDLGHEFDFRQVYAGVLEQWLGLDSTAVLGRKFEPPAMMG
jgi:uncharacterized protein (DUF1501 family)